MRSLGKLNSLKTRYYKFIIGTFFCIILIAASHINAFAQCDINDPDPTCDPDLPVPIDGGVSFLVAAGVAYGVKKIRDKMKEEKAIL